MGNVGVGGLVLVAVLGFGGGSWAKSAPPTTRFVALAGDADADCASNGEFVTVRHDREQSAQAFAIEQLKQGTSGLIVLGASSTGLWVLESSIPVDACDSSDCLRIELREVRFDGRRIVHNLSRADTEEQEMLLPPELAISRLQAMGKLEGTRVAPVAVELNDSPHLQTGSQSDWVMKVRDWVHRKTYTWKIRTGRMMCWCTMDYRQSTHLWR